MARIPWGNASPVPAHAMPPQPDRSLALTGASNFRDLGGYPAAQGRRVRWRRLFRSDHLGGLTPQDRRALESLGLARSIDLRQPEESAHQPYDLPGVRRHALPIHPWVMRQLGDWPAQRPLPTAPEMAALMRETYRHFIRHDGAHFAALLAHLLQDEGPTVFHCTAGKDRTGLAAALTLLALGVPREHIMQDYLLTNTLYRLPDLSASQLSPQALHVLWRVQPEYLQAAFDTMDAEYGGSQAYLQDVLGLQAPERERLAALYLEAV